MALRKEKFEQDAERMKSRSFPGYLLDKALKRADFSNEPEASEVHAEPAPVGSKNPANADALKAAGMKKGGKVKASRGDGIATKGKTKGRFI